MSLIKQDRIFVYQLLARLISMPVDQELLNQLASIESNADDTLESLNQAWQDLSHVAAFIDVEKLDDEFHHLFIGLGRGELLPFHSYYQSGFLMEKPLARLRKDLMILGFQRQSDNKEPEDHFSAVCEVMALLIHDDRKQQHSFYLQHIKPWFGHFFLDLEQQESSVFYAAVGRLGQAFLESEQSLEDLDSRHKCHKNIHDRDYEHENNKHST